VLPIVKTRIISFSIVKDKHCFKASTASLNDYVLDLKLLTSDNPPLSNEQNESIFKHVFEYIKRSERFLVVYVFHQGNNHTHTTPPTPTKETTTHTHNPTHPSVSLSFLSSFSVLLQFTHINVRHLSYRCLLYQIML
jgi:hypothetical protein